MDRTVDPSSAEAVRTAVRGGVGVREPADDLCPPWWPRRRSPRRALRANDGHADVRAADRVYLSLTLIASTFQYGDERLARDIRDVAVNHVLDAAQVLTRGAIRAWVHADEVCPPWPPGGHGPGLARGTDGVRLDPELPPRAAYLLDLLVLLHAYSLAARLPDAGARTHATTAIGAALLEQAIIVARAFR